MTPDLDLEATFNERDGLMWPRSDTVLWECARAFGVLQEATKLCKQHRIAIQAGGACGTFPRWLSQHFEHVYTWEPDPLNFICLVFNTKDRPNVTRLQAGIGLRSMPIAITPKPGNVGAGYLDGYGNIPVISGMALGHMAVDLIQLDVEGMELDALRSLEWFFAEGHKPVIVTEEKGLNSRYGHDADAVNQYLRHFGYHRHQRIGADWIYVADE